MHPDSQELDLIHQTPVGKSNLPSQKTRATVSPERKADASSPFSQDIASSPSFVDSEDSVPALGQSGSPSPTSRRVFFLSDAALDNSVPATPTTDIFEDAQVDNILDTPCKQFKRCSSMREYADSPNSQIPPHTFDSIPQTTPSASADTSPPSARGISSPMDSKPRSFPCGNA